MGTLKNSCIFRLWLVPLLLLSITKVYAALATPLPAENAAYSKTATSNRGEQSKMSNYFLHQPYGPNTYAFGYELEDAATGNVQFRDERRYLNGSIEGSYGYVRPDALIQVTRYKVAENGGYLANTQTYAAGDQQVEPIWPTQLPDLLKGIHRLQPASNVSWDAKSHLNVSVDQIADDVTQQLMEQHGLDLNHINVAQDVLQPAVLDIVNGKAPLQAQPNGSLSFQTLHNFIPSGFPIVPFELPAEQLLKNTSTTLQPALHNRTMFGNYNETKSNNDEKAPQEIAAAAVAESSTLPPPSPLVNSNSSGSGSSNATNWYQQIIQANRREFLQHLPNLNKVNV